jgi:hypothetical protein
MIVDGEGACALVVRLGGFDCLPSGCCPHHPPSPLPSQELKQELEAVRETRELTDQEAAALVAVKERLQAENEALANEARALRENNEELMKRTDRLLERQQVLEQCAESLKLENSNLIQQVSACLICPRALLSFY